MLTQAAGLVAASGEPLTWYLMNTDPAAKIYSCYNSLVGYAKYGITEKFGWPKNSLLIRCLPTENHTKFGVLNHGSPQVVSRSYMVIPLMITGLNLPYLPLFDIFCNLLFFHSW